MPDRQTYGSTGIVAIPFSIPAVREGFQPMSISSVPSGQVCHRKSTLLLSSHEATQVYSATVTQLHEALGRCSRSEFEALLRDVERHRAQLNAASEALERHI